MKNEKKERKCPSSDSRTTTAMILLSNRDKNGKKTRKKEGIEKGAQIRREFLFIVSIFINRNKKKNEKKRNNWKIFRFGQKNYRTIILILISNKDRNEEGARIRGG